MGFVGYRFQKCLLTSIKRTIYIYCSVGKGNQTKFAISRTLYRLHYFTSIFILHIYMYIYI